MLRLSYKKIQSKDDEVKIQDYVSEFYEKKRYAKSYSLAYHGWWAKKMLSFLHLKSPVLDNGCGTGFMTRFLEGYEVVGLDISPKMVELAKGGYSRVVLGDSQNLPFEDQSFQIVINRGLLHHLPDPKKGVSEMSRVLKKGGEAVFAEPTLNFFSFLPRKLLKRSQHFSHLHKNFKEKELEKIIGSQLKIEKVYYFGYLAYLLLGFPDIFDMYRFFPFKKVVTPLLIRFDESISKIPILNSKTCWGVMILARKQ